MSKRCLIYGSIEKACLVNAREKVERHPSTKEQARRNKVGRTAIKVLVVVFLMRFTSCASTSRVFAFFLFFPFKYIFVVSKKFALSSLPHHRFAFSCSEEERKEEWALKNKVFHRLIKAQCRSCAGKRKRVFQTFRAG